MIRRPPRSTLDRSSAASDVYKRQRGVLDLTQVQFVDCHGQRIRRGGVVVGLAGRAVATLIAVSYTHLRAHETVLDLVCRLLLEKKKQQKKKNQKKKQYKSLYNEEQHDEV